MSPEQAQGRPGSTAAPICSLRAPGNYEMLAGRRPFAADSELGMITALMTRDPAPLPNVPPAVDSILKRALMKEPAARYPNACPRCARISTSALAQTTAGLREPMWRRPVGARPRRPGPGRESALGIGTWQTVQARGVRWARETPPSLEAQATERLHAHHESIRLANAAARYAP